MTRHAQPRELAELKGALRVHPERYRKETPKHQSPLGGIPEHLGEKAKAVWFEIEAYSLPGVLTAADRLTFETLVNLVSEYREDPASFPTARIQAMLACLGRLGMSPADRQKLGVAKQPEGNKFDDF